MNTSILSEYIPESELMLDVNEAASRLALPRGYGLELARSCEDRLRGVLDAKFSAVRAELAVKEGGVVELPFGSFVSRDLARNLSDCNEAFILAVTLGYGADRLIKKLASSSGAEHFLTDALASAFAEAACDYAESRIKGNELTRRRFSPGYGDFPLAVQPSLLSYLNSTRLLGITLTDALIMTPSKSVTAIIGIERD